ncbi:hypothetical protein CJD36_013660 [Flavipsychrobacter stenotrophus]|uniref:Secretion system C-terminal sorting domain-containing protein n=1 Tax=Flavipsychrobacter stenotrophus TaxID=2077091 RepID=A0A2S7SVQ7_9BACT|nr:T9SS type A sorting domain-containing protein [Flavipsychrobacter stenotrophus]PQJ11010.1 hypothetical protein CJD36_013660 [Flavipsychrobacter stenotrophus]
MNKVFLLLFTLLITSASYAQITVTASDMPISGDTLRYSTASPIGSTINLGDSGTNMVWDYSALVPRTQAVDTYKTALSVSFTYALISLSAYGYKVSDTFPGGTFLPVSINQLYTFFEKKTSPSRFSATAFAAKIAGIPTPFNYTTDDDWYYFPLNYLNNDSSNFALTIGLTGTATLKQKGYRKTRVDGWGTIVTPFFTTPVNCLRVRSEIHEIDSVTISGFPLGFPRNTVEYRWLANGEHYPILWVTTNLTGSTETITTIRYRDMARDLHVGVSTTNRASYNVEAYPNPAVNGVATLKLPVDWKQYHVAVYDMQSKLVLEVDNQNVLNLQALAKGTYVAQVVSGNDVTYVQIVR